MDAQVSPPATTYHAEQSWIVSGAAVVGGSMMYAGTSDTKTAKTATVDITVNIVLATR